MSVAVLSASTLISQTTLTPLHHMATLPPPQNNIPHQTNAPLHQPGPLFEPEDMLHTMLLRRDYRDDCLNQARYPSDGHSYKLVTFPHPLLHPIPISSGDDDASFQTKLAIQLEVFYHRKNPNTHVVLVNTLTIRLMGTPRRSPTSSIIHTLSQDPFSLLLAPTHPLISYNWETPGQVLFHFITHPEDREAVRQQARKIAQELPPFTSIKLYHPLLPQDISFHPGTSDLLFLRVLHGKLFRLEGLWLIIPELESLPREHTSSYWAYRRTSSRT